MKLYDNNDLQVMLTFLQQNEPALQAVAGAAHGYFAGMNDSCGDKAAIFSVIASASAETFDRYDSAVCETFIRITEDVFGKGWNEKGISFNEKTRHYAPFDF